MNDHHVTKAIRNGIWLCTLLAISAASASTTFTYQGELKEGGSLANGSFDMEFSLWNAAAGGFQLGPTIPKDGVPVADGRFAVELDFGADVFNNDERFLAVAVEGFTLAPRTRVTRSPYSLQTRGIFVNEQELVAIGTTSPNTDSRLTVNSNGQRQAIRASSGTAGWPTIYGFNGNVDGHVLWADGISDVKLDQGGVMLIGPLDGENVAIDGNEIMARDDGSTSTLHLNLEGGHIVTGGRLGVGMNPGFGQLSVQDSDPSAAFGLSVETSNWSTLPSIYAQNLAGGPVLWAIGTSNISPESGGLIVAGDEQGTNVAIDNNEIMARNNGQPATLHLNLEGGPVVMGEYAIKPALAYGLIGPAGTILSGSANLSSVTKVGEGLYDVFFATPLLPTDIPVITCRGLFFASADIVSAGHMEVGIVDTDGDLRDARFGFVIYRP